jgi:hypothetical protein
MTAPFACFQSYPVRVLVKSLGQETPAAAASLDDLHSLKNKRLRNTKTLAALAEPLRTRQSVANGLRAFSSPFISSIIKHHQITPPAESGPPIHHIRSFRLEGNTAQSLVRRLTSRIHSARMRYGISAAARAEMRREQRTAIDADFPIDRVITEALAWIGRAQDNSPSADGGVARHYCLVTGWGASYPETTGYIVPTVIREGLALRDIEFRNTDLLERARRMLDWLVCIQMPCGGFRGGVTSDGPVVPVTFNTGQILLGLATGVGHFGEAYRKSMIAAADWLVKTQDADGCWRKHATPYATPGEKTYETHVAWGLYEAARVEPGRGYAEAASKNLAWAVSNQNDNQWLVLSLLPE